MTVRLPTEKKMRLLKRRRIPPSVLTWNDGLVLKMAKAIEQSRQFADLPILADALEEAGWNEQGVLNLLRSEPSENGWILHLLLSPRNFWMLWRTRYPNRDDHIKYRCYPSSLYL